MVLGGCVNKTTAWVFAASLLVPALVAEAGSASLSESIDRVIDAARPGPAPSRCTDAEFLRRSYLDLVGTIPSSVSARAFLDTSSVDKRTELVDQLLADPRFDLHFSRVFDVMLMERRPEKVIKPHLFRDFLRQSFEARKPLDQLVREILTADGAEPKTRPAARFLLDRDGETHELTRDVGRLLLGMDLQCAQCHDHPSIKDYRQADYHGIYALLNRSFVFDDKAMGKVMAERADGETNFVSVFVGGEPHAAVPHLPGGRPLVGPVLDKEKQYLVNAAEGKRPVPRYSSRRRLAEELTSGHCEAFQRNIANRIWCHMFGRGVVSPLDLHHAANPAGHPELPDLLADGLVSVEFDLRQFVRGIALSRTYQQSSELPPGIQEYGRSAAAHVADLEKRKATVTGRLDDWRELHDHANAMRQARGNGGDARDPRERLERRWRERGYCAMIRPLTAEQMAWSVSQALGVTERYQSEAAADLDKELSVGPPPEQIADPEARQRKIAVAVDAKISGSLFSFVVNLYDRKEQPAGDYSATAVEPLFFRHDQRIQQWIDGGRGSLSERLDRRTNEQTLAVELYLALLTRFPSDEEIAIVRDYLAARGGERRAAIRDLIAALMHSAEFRFRY